MFGGTQEKLEGGRMGLGMIKIHYLHIHNSQKKSIEDIVNKEWYQSW